MSEEQVCGRCKYNLYSPREKQKGQFYCDNEDSDNYGCPVAYDDECEDWEEEE